MINNINNLLVVGAASGVVAMATFGGAIRNQFKLQALRDDWDKTLNEPVPEHLTKLLKDME